MRDVDLKCVDHNYGFNGYLSTFLGSYARIHTSRSTNNETHCKDSGLSVKSTKTWSLKFYSTWVTIFQIEAQLGIKFPLSIFKMTVEQIPKMLYVL